EDKCRREDGPGCLTAKQVESVRAIYTPIEFHPGYMRGSELGWNTMPRPRPYGAVVDVFRYVVFQNPDWDFRTFNLATDAAHIRRVASDERCTPFLEHRDVTLAPALANLVHQYNDFSLIGVVANFGPWQADGRR